MAKALIESIGLGEKRIATLVDSPLLQPGVATFAVKPEGITDE